MYSAIVNMNGYSEQQFGKLYKLLVKHASSCVLVAFPHVFKVVWDNASSIQQVTGILSSWIHVLR